MASSSNQAGGTPRHVIKRCAETTMRCSECNCEDFERKTVELSTKVGVHTVVDRSKSPLTCANCGEFTISAKDLEAIELRAAVVAFTDAPLVTGPMLRFARKSLGLTQTELAARLGTTAESLSRWERQERPMETWVPLSVLALVRERLMPPPTGVEFRRAV